MILNFSFLSTMASKQIGRMGLDPALVHIFSARNILTAKDALSRTEVELMELLDIPVDPLMLAITTISEKACPECNTVLSVLQDRMKEFSGGHLPTKLQPLDDALCGGVPSGAVTELVGSAGIGKTQFCLTLCVEAILSSAHAGQNGSVIYIDTEHKFMSQRLVEIAQQRFPNMFCKDDDIRQLSSRIILLAPNTLDDLIGSLEKMQTTIIEHNVQLLIVDSVAALLQSSSGEIGWEYNIHRQELLGQQARLLKFLSESFRIPVVVTNQVRSNSGGEMTKVEVDDCGSELVAALGSKWAHSINIRLVLEDCSGSRCIRIAKSPISPALMIPYVISSRGIEISGDDFRTEV